MFEVILTLGSSGGFSGRLDCWKQECDQDADDGDHHQEFDQGKALEPFAVCCASHLEQLLPVDGI